MDHSLGKKKQVGETKNMIANAFRYLIEETYYNDITIYHILEKAGVSRRTFYRHFDNKEDLLDYILTMLIIEYYDEREKFLCATRPEDVFYTTLNFMYQNHQFIKSLILSGDYNKFTDKFNNNASIVFDTFDLPWNSSDKIASRKNSYFATALIGAYLNVIKHWLIGEEVEPPEVVAEDIAAMFCAIPNYFAHLDKTSQEQALQNLKATVEETYSSELGCSEAHPE